MECCDYDLSVLLEHFQDKGVRVTDEVAGLWFTQIAGATAHLHAAKVLHRDLKPPNIFVKQISERKQGETINLKLGDFGLAATLEPSERKTCVGTLAYLAPEMLVRSEYSEGVDVWGLGCVMLEVLTLNFLWEQQGVLAAMVKEKPVTAASIRGGKGLRLSHLVAQCLAYDPTVRPRAKELQAKLNLLPTSSRPLDFEPLRLQGPISPEVYLAKNRETIGGLNNDRGRVDASEVMGWAEEVKVWALNLLNGGGPSSFLSTSHPTSLSASGSVPPGSAPSTLKATSAKPKKQAKPLTQAELNPTKSASSSGPEPSGLPKQSGPPSARLDPGQAKGDCSTVTPAAQPLRFAGANSAVKSKGVVSQPIVESTESPISSPKSVEVLKAIKKAISKGAPAYNQGEVKKCYQIYKETAEKVMRSANKCQQLLLIKGLVKAKASRDLDQGAWALRHAFDAILDGKATAEASLHTTDLEAVRVLLLRATPCASAPVSSKVVDKIRAAIQKGVPLFNSGMKRACADVYLGCLQDIQGMLGDMDRRLVAITLTHAMNW
eukprot:CAMPEP_0184292388 /NCGR_PEP_ID=MMETSP1049-20130417/4188_1 /TAXON_ID=77928 /ORGANISM="Proteomonas sulcata, Strain CCMP704" /LENGTH=547 /DNA_ID=CAMNT_0026600157 /DNA_START=549 /DNA_END=2189 /DNA_ORIENTATION=-